MSNGTSTTPAPWMRAETVYMPNVGGQMSNAVLPGAAERAHQQVDAFVAAAAREQVVRRDAVQRCEMRNQLGGCGSG